MRPDATRCLLLIDDEPAQRRLVSAIGARAGWWVMGAPDVDAAQKLLAGEEGRDVDAIMLDHWLPGEAGADLIRQIRALRPDLPLLILTAQTSVAAAVDAMRAGANDFLVKPIAPDRLLAALNAATDRRQRNGELRPLSEKITKTLAFDEIVGSAPEFRAALAIAAKAARARVSVLIEGESGSGKEVLAQAIHSSSPRGKKPMVTVNCGAIPGNLVESVLFGHEKGAFTGAFDRHIGRFEDADGTTLFLDEIGELPLDTQVKLLRAIETGEIQRIGGRSIQIVDVRIIAATNRRLLDEVAKGNFREDLYYRLNVVHVDIPPLRARQSDIPPLARHLLARIAEQPGMRYLSITDDALEVLMAYGWPGNVRQLQNALFRAAVLCDGNALTAADFPHIAQESTFSKRADDYHAKALSGASNSAALSHGPGITLYESSGHLRSLEEIEADVIRLAIGHYRGRMTEVARRLGIGRSTLYRKLGELGIGADAA
ncbi:sigma-54 dependent transcriptional regulator [Sphingomonas sp. LY54]|uniref:sigma-54-dependent transcriptional regulator n=1 Tax=Sphingomonadales TaxID=204457 RepID=UPI002ADEDEF6|nr:MULTISPECIES: sigma-54 dependent transcriptional regulator [Sphingomonadales]MEA1014840.1 sigma-54 dependent transcriptional regulator [Sphingosinicella sp. LY1275]WRP29571.1 sigma-54 dependent transcriptional regulator [Sphingomonas sp. LY54]